MDKAQRFPIALYLDPTKSFPYHTALWKGRFDMSFSIFCLASFDSSLVYDTVQTLL